MFSLWVWKTVIHFSCYNFSEPPFSPTVAEQPIWKDRLLVVVCLGWGAAQCTKVRDERWWRSCSAECFVTDSVTCGQQTRPGRKQRRYPVQCLLVFLLLPYWEHFLISHQLLHSELIYCNHCQLWLSWFGPRWCYSPTLWAPAWIEIFYSDSVQLQIEFIQYMKGFFHFNYSSWSWTTQLYFY